MTGPPSGQCLKGNQKDTKRGGRSVLARWVPSCSVPLTRRDSFQHGELEAFDKQIKGDE